jgi:Zn-dependent oligopeptidase
VLLATFDQRLHTLPATTSAASAPPDTGALLTELHDRILRIPLTPGTNFAASFGHLAGGYSSVRRARMGVACGRQVAVAGGHG